MADVGIGQMVKNAITDAIKSAVTGMVSAAVQAGIQYIASKAGGAVAKAVGGNFGQALGQITGGAISGALGGAATNVLNSTFNTDRFRIGSTFGFNTEQIVGILVGAAGQDIANYVSKKVGGYAGFAINNIIYAATGAVQSVLFQVPYQQLDYQFIAEFGRPDLDINSYLSALGNDSHVFPLDIGNNYFLRLNFKKWERRAATSSAGLVSLGSLKLPIPQNLADNYSLQYNEVNLGALGGSTLDAIAGSGVLGPNATAADFNNLGQAANRMITENGLVGVLARRAAGALSDSIGVAIDQVTGNILNPYVTQAFRGVDLKSHTFTWRLAPRDPLESQQLKFIIKHLKMHAAPYTTDGGMRLEYPSLVLVEIYTGEIGTNSMELNEILRSRTNGDWSSGYLYPFRPAFITSVNVNYAPSGAPAFFKGTRLPVEVELSISLKEIAIHDRSFIQTGQSSLNGQSGLSYTRDRGFYDPASLTDYD